MPFTLKNNLKYGKTIAKLSIFTCLFVIGCILLGYICLPFASALYATVLLYEKKGKRIMSFVIPVFFLVVNVFINGLYSLECLAYVIIGLVIFASIKRPISKGETVFWTTTLITVFFIVSALFLAFNSMKSISVSAIKAFYFEQFSYFKTVFSDFLTSHTVLDESGFKIFAYNFSEAEAIFHEFVMLIVPLTIVLAFLVSGITFKFFAYLVDKFSGEACGIHLWKFQTSNFIAYFYLLVAIISMFAVNDGTAFTYVITSINTILAVVYFYIGVYALYLFLLSRGKSALFAITVIAFACLLFSSLAIQLLAFFGVYFNITANNFAKKLK